MRREEGGGVNGGRGVREVAAATRAGGDGRGDGGGGRRAVTAADVARWRRPGIIRQGDECT